MSKMIPPKNDKNEKTRGNIQINNDNSGDERKTQVRRGVGCEWSQL